jgi:hypothetical protein
MAIETEVCPFVFEKYLMVAFFYLTLYIAFYMLYLFMFYSKLLLCVGEGRFTLRGPHMISIYCIS